MIKVVHWGFFCTCSRTFSCKSAHQLLDRACFPPVFVVPIDRGSKAESLWASPAQLQPLFS